MRGSQSINMPWVVHASSFVHTIIAHRNICFPVHDFGGKDYILPMGSIHRAALSNARHSWIGFNTPIIGDPEGQELLMSNPASRAVPFLLHRAVLSQRICYYIKGKKGFNLDNSIKHRYHSPRNRTRPIHVQVLPI